MRLQLFRPVARSGAVGSLEWRWLEGFFRSYLPRLARRGLLARYEVEEFHGLWARRREEGRSWCCAPVVVDALLFK